jgi:hypothetical protein
MTTPSNTSGSSSSWGSPQDWSSVISGASRGIDSNIKSGKEAKEAKRRTLANLMNQAMRQNAGLFRTGQEYGDEMNDFQSQALQQIARGFVNALQGSTGRG